MELFAEHISPHIRYIPHLEHIAAHCIHGVHDVHAVCYVVYILKESSVVLHMCIMMQNMCILSLLSSSYYLMM